jgi:hypothetical protein
VKRRELLLDIGGTTLALLVASPLCAQAKPRMLRVGMATVAPRTAPYIIAFLIAESPLLVRDRAILVPLLLDRRIPAIGASPEDAQAGALISYGVDVVDVLRRAADYVDRIAKGAEPADLPIEQPTKFKLVINLKTACNGVSARGRRRRPFRPTIPTRND